MFDTFTITHGQFCSSPLQVAFFFCFEKLGKKKKISICLVGLVKECRYLIYCQVFILVFLEQFGRNPKPFGKENRLEFSFFFFLFFFSVLSQPVSTIFQCFSDCISSSPSQAPFIIFYSEISKPLRCYPPIFLNDRHF